MCDAKNREESSWACCPPPPPPRCKKHQPKKAKPIFCCENCDEEIEQEEVGEEEEDSAMSGEPCYIEPTPDKPGPEAYEEFEASFNNSGLVIRVLKDTHTVQVMDGGESCLSDEGDEQSGSDKCKVQIDNTYDQSLMKKSYLVAKRFEACSGGHIINHPNLPEVRPTLKHLGRKSWNPKEIMSQFKAADNQIKWHRRKVGEENLCQPISTMGAGESRACCAQVDPQIISQTMMGQQIDNRQRGLEVCRKTCNDMESDVFIVKLGTKQASQAKRNTVELELKTPKQASHLKKQKVSCETQTEPETQNEVGGGKKGKKGNKGKKGKKGKK